MIRQNYEDLASSYHWFYSDEQWLGDYFPVDLNSTLALLPPGATILDCACGIGMDAIALAKRGYNIVGSDHSAAMVAQAHHLAHQNNLSIPFVICPWKDLPAQFEQHFDLVLCLGNSISHCQSKSDLIDALQGMYKTLKNGGILLIGMRNWEKLGAQQPRLTVTAEVRQRNGMRCIPLYLWQFPESWQENHTVDVVMLLERDERVSYELYSLSYRPLRLDELEECLSLAGFGNIANDYSEVSDRYTITAHR